MESTGRRHVGVVGLHHHACCKLSLHLRMGESEEHLIVSLDILHSRHICRIAPIALSRLSVEEGGVHTLLDACFKLHVQFVPLAMLPAARWHGGG